MILFLMLLAEGRNQAIRKSGHIITFNSSQEKSQAPLDAYPNDLTPAIETRMSQQACGNSQDQRSWKISKKLPSLFYSSYIIFF